MSHRRRFSRGTRLVTTIDTPNIPARSVVELLDEDDNLRMFKVQYKGRTYWIGTTEAT
jgi:hypothetical protein